MVTVWVFYSGLIKLEPGSEKFHQLIKIIPNSASCRSAFESQQKGFCDEIMQMNSGRLSFSDPLTTTDLISIGYVTTTSSVPITELFIGGSYNYDDDRLAILFRHLQNACLLQLRRLRISSQTLDEGTKCLIEVLKLSSHISRLDMNLKHVHTSSAKEFANQINSCDSLNDVRISYAGSSDCIQSFVSSLKPLVTRLTLFFRELNYEQIEALGMGLQDLHVVFLYVTISNSDIDGKAMKCFVDGIQNIGSLGLNFLVTKYQAVE